MSEIPQILRIKRKRGQDPLQALVLEGDYLAKRSKANSPAPTTLTTDESQSNLYFELLDSENPSNSNYSHDSGLMLSEAAILLEKRQFLIPKLETPEELELSSQLNQMLDDFLSIEEDIPEKIKKRRIPKLISTVDKPSLTATNDKDEFVYDVYKLLESEPLTNLNFPQSQIGYIRFLEDEDEPLLNVEEARDLERSDDEDSNAESFYQNDYPEDEDGGDFIDHFDQLSCDSDSETDSFYEYGVANSITENDESLSGNLPRRHGVLNPEYSSIYSSCFQEGQNENFDLLENYDY